MINWNGQQYIIEVMDRIAAAGVTLFEDCEGWKCSDEMLAQVIVDAYTVEDARRWKCNQVAERAKALRDKAIALYSPAEMAAWSIKLAEAQAFAQTNDPASAPMLSAEAAVRGITLAEMMGKVQGNASSFATLEAQIAGIDGKHRDAIKALNSFEDVARYDYSTGWPEV